MITISDLAKKHSYLTESPYLFGRKIWEYDIRQANINALRAVGRIGDKEYTYLSNLPKQLREVYIGKAIRDDKTIQDSIYEGIDSAKLAFMEQNNIKPEDVIRIANDSVYVVSALPKYNTDIKINNHTLVFVNKNVFTSYMNLGSNVLFFYLNEGVDYNVDIKGINDNLLYLHNNFITFLCTLMDYIDNGGKEIAIKFFNEFYNGYISGKLPLDYYREFNSTSSYRINGKNSTYLLSSVSGVPKKDIDTNCNLMILRRIYSYLLSY